MRLGTFWFVAFVFGAAGVASGAGTPDPPGAAVLFEPNRGQVEPEVHHLARTPSGVIYFSRTAGVVLHRTGTGTSVRFGFTGTGGGGGGGATAGEWRECEPAADTISYMVGRDRRQWASGVPRYRRIERRGLYPGIDLVYYGDGAGNLEYDLILNPGADAAAIRLRVDGARHLSIDPDGALAIHPADGGAVVRHRRPLVYQTAADGTRAAVAGRFVLLSEDEAGFELEAYDSTLPVSIDPVIEAAAYLGGGGEDRVVAHNGTNSVGTTSSIDFPGQTRRRRGRDMFVRSGQATLIFGGSGDDETTAGVLAGAFGPILAIGGVTDSPDLPTTYSGSAGSPERGWQPEHGGGTTDGVVVVLNAIQGTLPSLITYAGGPGEDRITAAAEFSDPLFVGTTTERGLPPASSGAASPPMIGPGGGVDGFVLRVGSGRVSSVFYLGGSGDDIPQAVAVDLFGGSYVIAGETRSTDFPATGERKGPSDAFILHLDFAFRAAAGILFGGSGSDQATGAGIVPDGSIIVSGTTSSEDLPLEKPMQESYGGGSSDAFLAWFSPRLASLARSTYLGGSGEDRAVAGAANIGGDYVLGGWTTSTNLPVRDGAQPAYGGGEDDGFYAHFHADGEPIQVSYYGGSGSDRIYGVRVSDSPTVHLAGQTASPGLPVRDTPQTPAQKTPGGGVDGFAATVSTATFSASRLVGARGLRATGGIYLGNAAESGAAPVTVTSSDPGRVLVAADANEPGRASVELSSGQFFPASIRQLSLDCLTEEPGSVIISAPGYADRTAPVACLQPQATLLFRSRSLTFNPSAPVRLALGLDTLSIRAQLNAYDPVTRTTRLFGLGQRPGAEPVTISARSSNPSVGRLPVSAWAPIATLGGDSGIVLQPVDFGETEVAFESAIQVVPQQMRVAVGSDLNVAPAVSIASGFQAPFNIGLRQSGNSAFATVTSTDPSRLVVSTDPTRRGSASVTVGVPTDFNRLFFQALADSGEVQVQIALPEQPPVMTTVTLGRPVLSFGANNTSYQEAGQDWNLSLPVRPGFNLFLGPDSEPFSVNVESTDARVVPTPNPVRAQPGQALPAIRYRPTASGSTRLRLRGDGIAVDPESDSLEVRVVAGRLRLDSADTARDAFARMAVVFPGRITGQQRVTITSDTPAAVQLATSPQAAAAPEIVISAAAGFEVAFFARGMAAEGRARIRASVEGFDPVTATVEVAPAGFAWSTELLTLDRYPMGFIQALPALYALEPSSRVPTQPLSLASALVPAVRSSNTEVITVERRPLGSSVVTVLQPQGAGEAELTIEQPSGYTAPASRGVLRVRVLPARLEVAGLTEIAKDLVKPFVIRELPQGVSGEITVTSSDPSRLRISTSEAEQGSGSVTVRATPTSVSFYAHALASEGTVRLTATLAGFEPAAAAIRLRPPYLQLAIVGGGSSSGTFDSAGLYTTTTQSANTRLEITVQGPDNSGGNPRPGAEPVEVRLNSSRPDAGSTTQLTGRSGYVVGTAEFRPAAPGETVLSVVQPPGYVSPPHNRSVPIRVVSPFLQSRNILMAKDTITTGIAAFPAYARPPASDLTVTITSSDPTRVMVSAGSDGGQQPAASLTQTIRAGSLNGEVFTIHALGDSGIVPVRLSAPGLPEAAIGVQLSRLQVGFATGDRILTPQAGRQTSTVTLMRAAARPQSEPFEGVGTTLRPGLRVPVRLVSSNPAVVRVETPEITLGEGGSSSALCSFTPLAAGTAEITLELPSGFEGHPLFGRMVVTVR